MQYSLDPIRLTSAFKIQVLKSLFDAVFAKKNQQLEQELVEIIQENYDLHGAPLHGRANRVNYKGIMHSAPVELFHTTINESSWAKKYPIHEDLIERMEAYLTEINLRDSYANPVKGYLRRGLAKCLHADDVLVIFPEDVVEKLKLHSNFLEHCGQDNQFQTLSQKEVDRFRFEEQKAYSRIHEFLFIEQHFNED